MSETQQPHPYGSPCTYLCTTYGERHRHVTWVQRAVVPRPTRDELLEMFKELRGELHSVNGDCADPAWKDRGLHAPNCWCVWIAEIDEMLRATEADE